jgi:hypothetical protein
MREAMRFVSWRGEQFHFDRLEEQQDLADMGPVWAVSRRREFIGTMSGVQGETTKEFEVGCVSWLAALLGGRSRASAKSSTDRQGTP